LYEIAWKNCRGKIIKAEREVTRKLGNIMRVLGRKIPYSAKKISWQAGT
jgi:hypothetical protein